MRLVRFCPTVTGRRGERKQLAAEVSEPAPIPVAEREDLTFRDARLRWAELLRRIYEVDPRNAAVFAI